MTARRATAGMLLLMALAAGLVACGRRNRPSPPEGREAEYTYPRFYPAPATVLPDGADATEVEVERKPPPEKEIRRLSPVPSPTSRTTTEPYGRFSR